MFLNDGATDAVVDNMKACDAAKALNDTKAIKTAIASCRQCEGYI